VLGELEMDPSMSVPPRALLQQGARR